MADKKEEKETKSKSRSAYDCLSSTDALNGHMKNLKYFRCLRKYTIKSVAEEVGVRTEEYSKWENLRTDPTIPQMIALANDLHVSIDVLVGRAIGNYEYQKEVSNLIFGLNTQFELVQHELEQHDKCCFEIGNLRVSIVTRELPTEDKNLPTKEEKDRVLKEGDKESYLFEKHEKRERELLNKEKEVNERKKKQESLETLDKILESTNVKEYVTELYDFEKEELKEEVKERLRAMASKGK